MAETRTIPVAELGLDLANFRTVQQDSENDAVRAMVSTSPDRFWALVQSLLDDGYLPTESIIVLDGNGDDESLIVKEGNRRIAALKLILGQLEDSVVDVPDDTRESIRAITLAYKTYNREVPCVVYGMEDKDLVDRIVARAHGKGEKAGRDQWNAVARARHNRDAQGEREPALDLLEEYLMHGRNHTADQASRWAGDYPLTVLAEAMKRLAPRLGFSSSRELADTYPKLTGRDSLEQVVRAIGMKLLGFEAIRKTGTDFGAQFGIPATGSGIPAAASGGATPTPASSITETTGTGGSPAGEAENGQTGATGSSSDREAAISIRNPQSVKAKLRSFAPKGPDRGKVVTLRDEAKALNLKNNPLAFCFVLRSMFEISAKAYCKESMAKGGPSATKSDGRERTLVDILRDIVKHLTNNKKDKTMTKVLHGAMTEIARSEGLLSVTSMNQLVHNPNFNVTTTDVCVLFGNVFPLLEAMNE
jgi:hypothetical protein